jgi:hypothetical protein
MMTIRAVTRSIGCAGALVQCAYTQQVSLAEFQFGGGL